MTVYIFHRDEMFYPLELKDDANAIANAKCNPGTIKVTNVETGEIVRPNEKLTHGANVK